MKSVLTYYPADIEEIRGQVISIEPNSIFSWMAGFDKTRPLFPSQFHVIEKKPEFEASPFKGVSEAAFIDRMNTLPQLVLDAKAAFLKSDYA